MPRVVAGIRPVRVEGVVFPRFGFDIAAVQPTPDGSGAVAAVDAESVELWQLSERAGVHTKRVVLHSIGPPSHLVETRDEFHSAVRENAWEGNPRGERLIGCIPVGTSPLKQGRLRILLDDDHINPRRLNPALRRVEEVRHEVLGLFIIADFVG